MTNLNSFFIAKVLTCHSDLAPFSVLIVCAPLNSPATNRIINQYQHYRQTKILLIDIIGNVFSFGNRVHKNLNATEHNDLLVLTILTQKFKHILSSKYHVEFSRYLNVKGTYAKHPGNESTSDGFCDFEKQQHNNGSHYGTIGNNFTSCQREIKERCGNYSNEDIRSFCTNLTDTSRRKDDGDGKHYTAFNKQLVFSEHFNLFDFITSLGRDEKNASNHEQHHQFDFIVLDFKSILNSTNESIAFWRPLMILEQNEFDTKVFMMHRALSEHDAFKEWLLQPTLLNCGSLCWAILAAIILIIISLILIISLSAAIAAR